MLQLYTSNSLRLLADRLAERLGADPAPPLEQESIVILSPAMARWLNLRLCRRLGVVANVEYPLPASYVWGLARRLLGNLPFSDPFGREPLAWRIYALLPELLERSPFYPLRRYLEGDRGGVRLWQLAERVADLFDRYQFYRPELIREWSRGGGEEWQAQLWHALIEASGELVESHRVACIDRLIRRLEAGKGEGAPERLTLFGLSTLPPLFVQLFDALADVTRVECYLHSPTPEYWADLASSRQVAARRLEEPDAAHLWSVGNALLASWGRQGQAMQDLLLESARIGGQEELFLGPQGDTVLGRIKRDIFELGAEEGIPARERFAPDLSLGVRICHSAMRECQMLRDHLLGAMQEMPELRPEEILVLVPEITDYAPYIEAVFGRGGDESQPRIPWNLSDIAPSDEHPLIAVFLELLGLPESRLTHSELLSWLDLPALSNRFRIDGEGIAWLRGRLVEARVRWGWDGAHKAQIGLPETGENSWRQTLDRLFAGYAFEGEALFEGIAPLEGVEGEGAETLGWFCELLERLDHYRRELARPRTAGGWQLLLSELLDELFERREEEAGKWQQILDALADLRELAGEAGLNQELSPRLVRYWLTRRLGGESRGGHYFRGGVTFCGMKPMRGLPFKLICLLGMQDQAFPRRARSTEFDRMAADWRHGDPRPGDEDRYLFLEALLAADQSLYISYTGRDPRDNSERQPSLLVRELLDYIDARFEPVGIGDETKGFSHALTRVQPMQPYSPGNYRTLDEASFDPYWRTVGERMAMARPIIGEGAWPERALPPMPEPPTQLTLEQLGRFLAHPVRHFVQNRLWIFLGEDDPPPQDDEPFVLDGLESYLIRDELLEGYLRGETQGIDRLRAQGRLPHAATGELTFERIAGEGREWLAQFEGYRGQQPLPLQVDLPLSIEGFGEIRLSGRIAGCYPGLGLLHAHASNFKGRQLLGFWLDYLAWCAQGGDGPAKIVALDEGKQVVAPPSADGARELLAGYIGLYLEGERRPLPLLPNGSFAYARRPKPKRAGTAQDEMAARLLAASREWDAYGGYGDRDDPYIRLLMRGVEVLPLEHPEFPRLAMAIYGPALAAVGEGVGGDG